MVDASRTPEEVLCAGPFISVIMPNLNGAKYLGASIDAFLAQSYPRKELLIVDGCSSDTSHSIIDDRRRKSNDIIWISEPDSGISHALNLAVARARGDVIGYLGSDDIMMRGVLESVAYHMTWSACDCVYFDSYTVIPAERKCVLRTCPPGEWSREKLLEFGTIAGLQDIMFRRHVLDKHRFDESNRYSMDYELYLRISQENYMYVYVNEVATANISDGNISADPDGRQHREAVQVAKRYADDFVGLMFFERALPRWRRLLLRTWRMMRALRSKWFASRRRSFASGSM